MPEPRISIECTTVTCPFCGLGCDDLSLTQHNATPRIEAGGCRKAEAAFADALAANNAPAPQIDGQAADLQEALQRATAMLRRSQAPLFGGLAGDLGEIRAALRLAQACGGMTDHLNGQALTDTTQVLQHHGWITTTLGEARNRADLWVLVDTGLDQQFPRLEERLLGDSQRLHLEGAPRVLRIGPDANTDGMPIALDQLRDFIGVVRARAAGRPLGQDVLPAAAVLAEQLKAARYPVILFNAAGMGEHADLLIQSLAALVKDLNESGRAALLPLAGGNGDITAQQASLWHSGFGVRSAFPDGLPDYRPLSGAGERLLEHAETDLLIWISSLCDQAPPLTEVPTLVLGHPAIELERTPEVYIPLAVPGVHRDGALHRGDNIALQPLYAVTDSRLPNGANVLHQLLQLYTEEQDRC